MIFNFIPDLDTIASSVAFAWLRTTIFSQPTVALLQMDREDLDLRAENLYALQLAGISHPKDQLLFTTDLAEFKPFPSHKFALVDHNRLASTFTPAESPVIVAIVDHHADEALYTDTADPRMILPAGSCASLISSLFNNSELPPELATLLLSAIIVDTDGLRPDGKAIDIDRKAANFLAQKSTLASSLYPVDVVEASSTNTSSLFDLETIKTLSKDLSAKKDDVAHLGPRDLLRRDYKQYEFVLPWHAAKPTIRAGLSTVPVRLEQWAVDGKLEVEGEAWMKERGLHILGVLTSYRGETKGKRKREMAWIMRTNSPPPGASEEFDFDVLAERLWNGLESDLNLEVKKHKKFAAGTLDSTPSQLRVRIYSQNPHATRKITAPVLKAIMEAPN